MSQKVKNKPKFKSNSNVWIEGIIENESYSTTWVDPKTVFEPYPDTVNSQIEPQKLTPKFSQIQKLELKES